MLGVFFLFSSRRADGLVHYLDGLGFPEKGRSFPLFHCHRFPLLFYGGGGSFPPARKYGPATPSFNALMCLLQAVSGSKRRSPNLKDALSLCKSVA